MSPEPLELRGPARATLEIDLAALTANWRMLAARAAPAETAAVVKADAYGLGLEPVARALARAGCRTFFVARLEEGVALRGLLSDARIFVLDGIGRGEEEDFVAHRLVPVLNQQAELEHWRRCARHRSRPLPAALHLDTGMTRLGFLPRAWEQLEAPDLEGLRLLLVMSHLACADEPGHPLNARQLALFRSRARRFGEVPLSLAASSGIFLGREYHFDLCRPGVALYGVNPTPGAPNPMRPVVRLVAPLLQVHDILEERSVGYGATFTAQPGMRIATVGVGYADGIPRAASARARARIAGRSVPYAGRVSMDLLALDVSALPPELCRPGTEVELLGGADGIDALAAAADTIGYEILVRLGRRFRRVYRREGEAS